MTFYPLIAADLGSSMDLTKPLADRISVGLEVALLGMLVVFAVLGLIFAILTLFRVVFYDLPKKRAGDITPKALETVTEPPVIPKKQRTAPIAPTPTPAAAGDDPALIAVITAAVAAYMQAEGKAPGSFRVVSFKKKR